MSKDYNKEGEQDAKEGKHNPPGPPLSMELIGGLTDKEVEDKKQYRAGWRNTTDQKKKS